MRATCSVCRLPVARMVFMCPRRLLAGPHLVVEQPPVAGQHMLVGDDDVDLPGTRPLSPSAACRAAKGPPESRAGRGDRDTRSPQRLERGGDETVVTQTASVVTVRPASPSASCRSARSGRRALAQRQPDRDGAGPWRFRARAKGADLRVLVPSRPDPADHRPGIDILRSSAAIILPRRQV